MLMDNKQKPLTPDGLTALRAPENRMVWSATSLNFAVFLHACQSSQVSFIQSNVQALAS